MHRSQQRNAKNHFSKPDASEFQQRWRAIKASWNLEVGNQQFEKLCDRFANQYPAFIDELRKKRMHYLAFPQLSRKHSSFSVHHQHRRG